MTRPTKAPWVIHPPKVDGGTIQIRDKDGGAIAQVWGSDEEAYANAALIQAAPRLLDLLENVAIANNMGWDMDGLASEVACTLDRIGFATMAGLATLSTQREAARDDKS